MNKTVNSASRRYFFVYFRFVMKKLFTNIGWNLVNKRRRNTQRSSSHICLISSMDMTRPFLLATWLGAMTKICSCRPSKMENCGLEMPILWFRLVVLYEFLLATHDLIIATDLFEYTIHYYSIASATFGEPVGV